MILIYELVEAAVSLKLAPMTQNQRLSMECAIACAKQMNDAIIVTTADGSFMACERINIPTLVFDNY